MGKLGATDWHSGRRVPCRVTCDLDVNRVCYPVKWHALMVFVDYNRAVTEAVGMNNVDPAGYDATNEHYGLEGKHRALTLGDAIWESLRRGRPWCIENIEVDVLNDNPAVRNSGHEFRIPDHVLVARMNREEQAYWEGKQKEKDIMDGCDGCAKLEHPGAGGDCTFDSKYLPKAQEYARSLANDGPQQYAMKYIQYLSHLCVGNEPPIGKIGTYEALEIRLSLIRKLRVRGSKLEGADLGVLPPDRKDGEWNVVVSKDGRGGWRAWVRNPQGGGSGEGGFHSGTSAIKHAMRHIPPTVQKVWTVVEEWSYDSQNYITKRAGYIDRAYALTGKISAKLGELALVEKDHVEQARYYMNRARKQLDDVLGRRERMNDPMKQRKVDCDLLHEMIDKAVESLHSAYEHLYVSIRGEDHRDSNYGPLVLDYRSLRIAIAKQHEWFAANCVRR